MDSSRGFKNLIYGIGAQIITLGLGIIIPHLVLVNLGSEANGLLNSVNSILAYMSLLEAGVGTATLQALYRPISKSDKGSINRILSATNFFYKRTGNVYLFSVITIAFVYTFFVKTELPKVDVFLVVLLTGLAGVLSYYFQGKYSILLSAEGKGYVNTNVSVLVTVFTSTIKVVLLVHGFNVVAVQISYFVIRFLQVFVFIAYMKRFYSWLDLSVTPDFEAISQKNAVLVHQITNLIFNSTDTIILTIFTTLKVVSVYSMYALIFGLVKTISVTISDSFLYAVGQSYGNKERFMKLFNAFEVYNMAITFALFCIAKIFILPFLRLYTQGVSDINYLDGKVAWLFVIFYLLNNGRKASAHVIDIAQHFEQTKWRAVLEAVINITVSIALTIRFGIYGVLLGTIAALLYRTNDIIIYASGILERSPFITYKRWFQNIAVFGVFVWISSFFDLYADNYFMLLVYGVAFSLIIVITFILVNSVIERTTAHYVFGVLRNKIREVIHR